MHVISFEVMKCFPWNNLISLNISSLLVVGARTSETTLQLDWRICIFSNSPPALAKENLITLITAAYQSLYFKGAS